MPAWKVLLQKPGKINIDPWIVHLAARLLRKSRIEVGGKPHRIVEIEFYLHTPDHPDPFTHRHPLQKQAGHWYFHRTGNSYRNGSFKGMDLTVGVGAGFGGVLIRGLETPDGKLIDGPSLCVDYLLSQSKVKTIAELDGLVGGRACWEPGNPLRLQTVASRGRHEIFRSARIGLFLKRAARYPDAPRYIILPYRFLTEPRRLRKGKLHLVLGLHKQGVPPEEIRRITGSPLGTIQRYIEEFEIGRKEGDFAPYFGVDLGPRELCRLHGMSYLADKTRVHECQSRAPK